METWNECVRYPLFIRVRSKARTKGGTIFTRQGQGASAVEGGGLEVPPDTIRNPRRLYNVRLASSLAIISQVVFSVGLQYTSIFIGIDAS